MWLNLDFVGLILLILSYNFILIVDLNKDYINYQIMSLPSFSVEIFNSIIFSSIGI